MVGTSKLRDLYERFEEDLVRRQDRAKAARPQWDPPKTKLDEDPGGWSTELNFLHDYTQYNHAGTFLMKS